MSFDYDIGVIGGGIHGVAVAQAAAARGYRTILLEQYSELAQGTSSRSSKLIHGGLRYLENLSFRLVRECLAERRILLKNAPDLVRLRPFYIPVYRHSRRSRASIFAGLSMYRLLGGGAFSWISKREWAGLDGINLQGLLAVFRYYDAQTDDAALTRAVMRSASELGAELKLGARVTDIELLSDGANIHYQQAGQAITCKVKVVVNAAGPWAAETLHFVNPSQTIPSIDLVQGTHIITDERLTKGCYYLEASDGRPVFFLPWKNQQTLIGTTETIYTGSPQDTRPQRQEIEYLLTTRTTNFPGRAPLSADEINAFSGLRVLPKSDTNPNDRKRETLYLTDRKEKPRILTILGGKLTAHRATAEKVLQHIAVSLPDSNPCADTRQLRLSAED